MIKPKLIPIGSNIGLLYKLVFYTLAALLGLAIIGFSISGGPIIIFVIFTLLLIIFLL